MAYIFNKNFKCIVKQIILIPRNPAPAPNANAPRPPPPNNRPDREPPRTLVPPPYLYIKQYNNRDVINAMQ